MSYNINSIHYFLKQVWKKRLQQGNNNFSQKAYIKIILLNKVTKSNYMFSKKFENA